MTTSASFDDDFEEFEEVEEENEDRGLSGLVVLLMGLVMIGAVVAVAWIAFQQGMKTGLQRNGPPTVTADPADPIKIENTAGAAAVTAREVFDRFEGAPSSPVEVIAAGPERPVNRAAEDPIAAIAAEAQARGRAVEDDAVADRIASLSASDQALNAGPSAVPSAGSAGGVSAGAGSAGAGVNAATAPKPAQTTPAQTAPAQTTQAQTTQAQGAQAQGNPTTRPAPTGAGALSGSHVIQVGAFRSQSEANGVWTRMQGKLGGYLDGKAPDIEVADLGDKGIYYRLRIGPFAGADAARSYCAGLKERGQDCIVKAK